ncbi:MAG: radical SAM protein [Candidatus Omnitrophota bacterium]
MNIKYLSKLCRSNFLFWLSRKIDYPLLPPDMVQVNFTFECNLRCTMCSMHQQKEFLKSQGRQVEIDSDTFRKVIRGTKELGTRAILFIGGEPFIKKDLFSLVSYAKSLGLSVIVVTNGVLLNEEIIEKCFESGVEWLSISIDAAKEETFSRIRGKNILGTIIKNIELFNNLKEKQKKEFPKIVTVCTIMDNNIEELSEVARLCQKLKIERVLFQPVVANNIDQTQRKGVFPGFLPPERLNLADEAIDKLISFKKKSPENFSFIANNIRYLKLIKKYLRGNIKHWELPCYAGYNRVQIVQEGKLYFCVNQKKYTANFGDIKKDSLKDLWYSQQARFYRKIIRKCKTPCLQWCSYRDDFIILEDFFRKKLLFKDKS